MPSPRDSASVTADTLFRAEYIIARFTLDGLIRQDCIHLNKAYISNAQMNLILENKPDNGDGDITTDNLSRIFRLKKPEQPRRSEKEIFHIKKVEISNMGFAMKNHRADEIPYGGGIDWNNLQVNDININARELQFKRSIMSGELDHLAFREKSGWVCESLTGEAEVGRGRTIVNELRIKDRWSEINMPLFTMSYNNSREFQNFTELVKLEGTIEDTRLDFRTLWYFVPALYGNDLKASLSGKFDGHVEDLRLDGIQIGIENGLSGNVSGRLAGVTDTQKTFIDADLRNFLFTSESLSHFIGEWSSGKVPGLGQYAKGILLSMKGKVSGKLNDLNMQASLSSITGKADADIRLTELLSDDKSIGISGRFRSEDLDIGRFIDKQIIGPVSLRTGFDARFGRGQSIPDVNIDSVIVDRLHLNGYDYSGIAATGQIDEKSFDGRVISNDPNLNFMFHGTFALSGKTQNSLYRFYANIGHADLNALNIDRRGKSEIRLQAHADFAGTSSGEVTGNAGIAGIVVENSEGRYELGDISLTSHSAEKEHMMTLDSKFAHASFKGTSPLSKFIKDITDLTVKKEIPSLFQKQEKEWNADSYDFSFRCHDLMDVLDFVMPGLYIESGTSAEISINEDGELKGGVNSGRIAFKKQYLKELSATFDNMNDSFNVGLQCDEIKLASIRLNDNSLNAHASDNHIGIGYTYDNHGKLQNKGEFIISSDLIRKDDKLSILIETRPSSIYFNSKKWDIMPSTILMEDNQMEVDSFGLMSGEEFIGLEGGISDTSRDTITLSLQRFDISFLNSLTDSGFGIDGALTGTAQLTSPYKDKGILIDLLCDSTYVAGHPLGVVSIGSSLNEENGGFDVALINEIEGRNSLAVNGNIALNMNSMSLDADLDRLSIGYVQPFVSDIFSEMSGYISGNVNINGTLDNLDIRSEGTMLDEAMLRVAATNVPYLADGSFHLDKKGVYFDNIVIKDMSEGTGEISGSINWNNFKDITFNTLISVNQIEGINLTEDLSETFYGNIYGTGNISITGPVSSLVMNIDAATAKTGQLHIPMNAAGTTGTGENLLRFTEEKKEISIDPYEAMINKITRQEEAENDFTLRMRVSAQPDVEAFVEIDKASGNVLSGRGNGVLDLEVGNDIFEINGDYTLTGGNYKFVAIGLVSRDFEIQDGSSIRFNGDIMESTLDIDAIYKTKASLSTLIADTTSVANRRTVECGINITEKISNPRLAFSIEIPDLDPTVKSRVESALSTDDKIQKQFLSLLLSNSFLPDEQSGIVNNTTLLYSNVTEAMANQLNNIFHKLDIPLDLGLNYQPNEKGNDIFDVAVSTQLFNNRVVVNGSVGNKQYTSGGTQDVVGDLDIEIKLDRSGSFRLNLFSHSADSYTNYLDNSQRNGVGLTYQTEFNSLGQFFRNMFMSKERRQAAKQAEEQAVIDGGKVEIKIEAPSKKKKDERRKR